MTGKGGARAPILYNGKEFRVDVYNLEEEQNGFHRGCDEDEIWFQFRGHSLNHTEWGALELDPGQMLIFPRGVAHRITGSPGFLRMVLYSRELVHPKAFNDVSGATRASTCNKALSPRRQQRGLHGRVTQGTRGVRSSLRITIVKNLRGLRRINLV